MMMSLSSCTKAIKNVRLKKPHKRRTLTHCLASIKVVGLVYDRR